MGLIKDQQRKCLEVPGFPSTEVSVKPAIKFCNTFLPHQDGEYENATIVVVPVKISNRDGGTFISWSCNRGGSCYESSCIYSYASRVKLLGQGLVQEETLADKSLG